LELKNLIKQKLNIKIDEFKSFKFSILFFTNKHKYLNDSILFFNHLDDIVLENVLIAERENQSSKATIGMEHRDSNNVNRYADKAIVINN
jgi:hypothetical protein